MKQIHVKNNLPLLLAAHARPSQVFILTEISQSSLSACRCPIEPLEQRSISSDTYQEPRVVFSTSLWPIIGYWERTQIAHQLIHCVKFTDWNINQLRSHCFPLKTQTHVCTHADEQIIDWPFQTASSAPPVIMERKGEEEDCKKEEVRTAIESLSQLSRSWPAAWLSLQGVKRHTGVLLSICFLVWLFLLGHIRLNDSPFMVSLMTLSKGRVCWCVRTRFPECNPLCLLGTQLFLDIPSL